jgi:peptidoglycan/xylan/chitin deacetylase (PgdA/CDA1 family)
MNRTKKFILTLDIEEFDAPLEYGRNLPETEQFEISRLGLEAVLQVLERQNIRATFFVTAHFALQHPDLIRKLAEPFEIASHGFFHSSFEADHLLQSRRTLEAITGKSVLGYRMARMMPVPEEAIAEAGYMYNSSLNPTFIPGRYNHLKMPRLPFLQSGVWQIPASVTPGIRFPLFWLSFKNFPLFVLQWASQWIHRRETYVNLYFHPWEFTDISDKEKYGLPFYISRFSGEKMLIKLEAYLVWAKKRGEFITFADQYQELLEL